jgi:hypothetical protein
VFYYELRSLSVKTGAAETSVKVTVSEVVFDRLVRAAIKIIQVDEDWYIARYDDVRAAVSNGIFASGKEHYATAGYFEDRLPFHIEVDEVFYLKQNPDVGAAIVIGDIKNSQEHYERSGHLEGRAPYEGFSLF